MVKAVLGDDTQLNLAEDRLFNSGIPTQVGLIIGKINSDLDRGFVFDLVPTPPNDAGEPACSISESVRDEKKKGLKGKSQMEMSLLVIDRDWVAEHARQVSRMLLGGMNVVGIYVWAVESSFKASSTILWQTVKGVAEAAPFYESGMDERLLIHISYSPTRWTCRNCIMGSSMTSTSLRPCDFKMGKLLASLPTFRCKYNFEMRLPIFLKDASNASTLRDIICNGISCHAKELKGAKAIVDGNLVFKDQQSTSNSEHEVELLLPFMKDGPSEVCSMEEIVGLVIFSGAIYSSAYLCPKEPISQVISDIKGDIISSLRSRLDIICDGAEGDVDSTVDSEDASNEIQSEKPAQLILHESRKRCSLSFPRRVLVPWLADVFICDYLQPSETFEEVKDHCKEMMSMVVPQDVSAILEVETGASPLTAKSFWDAIRGNSAPESHHSARKSDKGSTRVGAAKSKYSNLNIVTALAILLLSILIGLVIMMRP
ncbi:oxidoreductase, zinc-binding dehydrogenase family protein [Tasmannia lanceolata]|uniref:oxidoreductase, zinc-binding dehydrogenase family protein n=1 Tax=Tasmannia lanceolata TaxID=3420 RepID=UPI00406290CB